MCLGSFMKKIVRLFAAVSAFMVIAAVTRVDAQSAGPQPAVPQSETRIAFVVGNAEYPEAPLLTSANDAGLIAQTLQAAGFDVIGARDLDEETFRRSFKDFLQKAAAAGPNTVAAVYLSGYGLQFEGENYFVPVGARIVRDTDVPISAIRVSDLTRPLAAMRLKASFVVLDAARNQPYAREGQPLAGGLALVEPETDTLIAFNAAPGTIAQETQGPYAPFAQGLAEMLREGGLPLDQAFDRARLRVNELTKGAQIPWSASRLRNQVTLFERAPDAPAPAVSAADGDAMRRRPLRELGAESAYAAAIERDTLKDYENFIEAYPTDPLAKRVRAIVAARRESITWRRTVTVGTPEAYWSYLRRYPNGPHAGDARRRLDRLTASYEPPRSFRPIPYDIAPPPREEVIYIERPVLYFDDPDFGFAPPPPPPFIFLPPRPRFIVELPPPPPPIEYYELPSPNYVPVPIYVRPPVYVQPPRNNFIFVNIHNSITIDQRSRRETIVRPDGQVVQPQVPQQPQLGSPVPGLPTPGLPTPGLPTPGLPTPGLPGQAVPVPGRGQAGQVQPAPPGQPVQAQPIPGQPIPGQPIPGQPSPRPSRSGPSRPRSASDRGFAQRHDYRSVGRPGRQHAREPAAVCRAQGGAGTRAKRTSCSGPARASARGCRAVRRRAVRCGSACRAAGRAPAAGRSAEWRDGLAVDAGHRANPAGAPTAAVGRTVQDKATARPACRTTAAAANRDPCRAVGALERGACRPAPRGGRPA